MTSAATAVALALATLASEDLATIGAAILASMGKVGALTALLSVGAGIYVGDLGLFVAGRAARRVPRVRRFVLGRWSADQLAAAAARFERGMAATILASRFLPGSRLPVYVAAGLLTDRAWPFCAWTFAAVALWTPVLFGGTLWIGQTFTASAHAYLTWAPAAGLILGLLFVSRLFARMPRHAGPHA